MARYWIRAEHTFSAAHALRLPDGSLEPMHGHDWTVRVTVSADTLDGADCVMDFHALMDRLRAVVGPWSNRCLNEVTPFADASGQLVVNVSAERVAEQVGLAVMDGLPEGVKLEGVSVSEAVGCVAGWEPAGKASL
ncbi:MAG: 6-pyruvoyl tetrahydropterin synthase family protein [Planctomycetota bacterium]